MKVNWDVLSHREKVGTGGHRVSDVYRWAVLNSYPQLLFDFEMQALFNHRPSIPAPQPIQTMCFGLLSYSLATVLSLYVN